MMEYAVGHPPRVLTVCPTCAAVARLAAEARQHGQTVIDLTALERLPANL